MEPPVSIDRKEINPMKRLILPTITFALAALLALVGCGGPRSSPSSFERQQYIRWMDAYFAVKAPEDDALKTSARTVALVNENRRLVTVLESAVESRIAWERLRRGVAAHFPMPTDPQIARLDHDYRTSVGTLAQAFRNLADAVEAAPGMRAAALVDRYSRLRRRGGALLIHVGERTVELYNELGGEQALGGRLSFSKIRARAKPPNY
jgi:hypothetical protein